MEVAVWRRGDELLKNATYYEQLAKPFARQPGAWRRPPAGARMDAHQAAVHLRPGWPPDRARVGSAPPPHPGAREPERRPAHAAWRWRRR
eukprot:7407533-Alexandrium_andersonii.AAC.1